MTRETEFTRIKRAVENEKTKKMQSEARLESLNEERARIIKEANSIAEREFATVEEVEVFVDEMKADIEKKIKEMGDILTAEGVSY